MDADAFAQADALLRKLSAAHTPHPGGTLLAHLHRVRARLAGWSARPALQLAGLCHALYGTDGFPHPLLPLDRRADVRDAIGVEAEALVHLYASCDRTATYPTLATPNSPFRDRFSGHTHTPALALRQDFAELTAANELDLAAEDPAFRDRHGPALLALFTRFRPLLSQPAWEDCTALLPGP
ncbi:hypothetical protein SAMN06272735_4980 [Streptomyces sp. TLI_55]|uniref:DUF6817 domain-containing protein n=1 Tax=Streptomyces sp. TLI_55 TaxID=1938861 RepID=UPI000BDC85D7|nr:hypothetical protein [Streptomyces sp. TLI_55]SNX63178.1 hypothetical protein SAMN06272735_4980 [Streptomyces sp. TLI_55]